MYFRSFYLYSTAVWNTGFDFMVTNLHSSDTSGQYSLDSLSTTFIITVTKSCACKVCFDTFASVLATFLAWTMNKLSANFSSLRQCHPQWSPLIVLHNPSPLGRANKQSSSYHHSLVEFHLLPGNIYDYISAKSFVHCFYVSLRF